MQPKHVILLLWSTLSLVWLPLGILTTFRVGSLGIVHLIKRDFRPWLMRLSIWVKTTLVGVTYRSRSSEDTLTSKILREALGKNRKYTDIVLCFQVSRGQDKHTLHIFTDFAAFLWLPYALCHNSLVWVVAKWNWDNAMSCAMLFSVS